MTAGSYVYNSTKGKRERIGRILQMHANHREEIEQVYSGDIAAAVGLKDTTTGDTLCDEKNEIILESMVFPDPVISVAVEPKTKADQEKMGIALQKLAEEDPTFRVHTDPETSQTIISGMGELHLDIIVDRLLREFKVGCTVGNPQLLIAKPFAKLLNPKVNLFVSPVVKANMVIAGWKSLRVNLAKASCLKTKLLAALFLKNTSLLSKQALKKLWKMA